LFVFNGRFIYAQIKYSFIGPPELKDFSEKDFVLPPKNEEHKERYIPSRLVIPVIGVDAPVVLPQSTNEADLQIALEKGVIFWPGSALLGENGAMIILGHSSAYPWYRGNYGSVFSLLDKLQIGDEIFIYVQDKQFGYRVLEKQIELPQNLSLEANQEGSVLYLLSCWPIRTDWKRIAIKAISIDKI